MKKRVSSIVLLLVAVSVPALAKGGPSGPTAMLTFLQGAVTLERSGEKPAEAAIFTRLAEGDALQLPAGARAVVVFIDGNRCELTGPCRVTSLKNGFSGDKAQVKSLAPVAVRAAVAPIATNAGRHHAATRIRGARIEEYAIQDLRPAGGDCIPADCAILSFRPVTGVEKYRVEIEDEMGQTILDTEVHSAEVQVSPGILQPGSSYFWKVRTLGQMVPPKRGDAVFITLEADKATGRTALKRMAETAMDPSLWLLLAEFDVSAGMAREACRSIAVALSLAPGNPAVQAVADQAGCR